MSAVWSVGFRPFFILVMLSGMAMPVLWVLVYAGALPQPYTGFSSLQWHAHEMFFGFGWALLAGFLLTASKNWVGVRGFHGPSLQYLTGLWLVERCAMWTEAALPPFLFLVAGNLFLVSAVSMLCWTLARHRKSDSYPDNYFFLLLTPLFIPAKLLLLSADGMGLGQSMAIGLFRLAFLIMLERTLTQFMKAAFGLQITRRPWLDKTVKWAALLLVFESLLPPFISSVAALFLALLLGWRFVGWRPAVALKRLDIGIMYLGYLLIVLHLLAQAGGGLGLSVLSAGAATHIFTLGVIGLIAPAMIIRISKGHTGRKVVFDRLDKAALWIMILSLVSRVVLAELFPQLYLEWIGLAALGWLAAFFILFCRYFPILLRPRIDGRTQ